MSRELADSDPRKWAYTEHARAKHAIQRTYLGAWLAILGTRFSPLVLFDGFAGRGRYEGGEEGSPLLFWRRAVEAVDTGRPSEVRIRCVEANADNYRNLCEVTAGLERPGVTIKATHGKFAQEAAAAAGRLRSWSRTPPPSFWTADPYGFAGVPLDVISDLMQLPRAEVLITFMVRDMRRFLGEPNFEAPLNQFFGGDAWRRCVEHDDADERERCLLLTYSQIVRDGVARFATPFRVFEDERRQTLYYLVHLTNNPLGMRQMKRAMIQQSPDMTFWPVTVRSPDQLTMDTEERAPFPSLQRHLLDTYGGQTLTFEALINADYPTGLWLEPDYRAAVADMEQHGLAQVQRDRSTPTGIPPKGVKLEDTITVSAQTTLI
jgi:three-Cys-motif partner protein